MKKSLLIIAVIATVGLVACKKDYTCTCTLTDSSTGDSVSTSATINAKKKDAQSSCESGNYTSGTTTYSCKLD